MMQLRINEFRGRLADRGVKVSIDDIAEATGIDRQAVRRLGKG